MRGTRYGRGVDPARKYWCGGRELNDGISKDTTMADGPTESHSPVVKNSMDKYIDVLFIDGPLDGRIFRCEPTIKFWSVSPFEDERHLIVDKVTYKIVHKDGKYFGEILPFDVGVDG